MHLARLGHRLVVDGELNEPARCAAIHGGRPQLQRVHFAETLEALHVDLAFFTFRFNAIEHALSLLSFVERCRTLPCRHRCGYSGGMATYT